MNDEHLLNEISVTKIMNYRLKKADKWNFFR